MPKLLIANLDNPSMMGDQSHWSREFYLSSTTLAMRHAWFAEPGDVVILPRPLSDAMKTYMADLMSYREDDVTFLSPAVPAGYCGPMGIDLLLSSEFKNRLSDALSSATNWNVWPYFYDRGIATVVNALRVQHHGGSNPFLLEGGAELFNDKRVFRAIAAGRQIPLAAGYSVTSLAELARATAELIEVTGSVIVKQDRHSSTDGNVLLTNVEGIFGQGASHVYPYDSGGTDIVKHVWDRLGYQGGALVVEAYYSVQKILYAEFFIKRATGSVEFRNWGSPRMNPSCFGLVIPPTTSPFLAAKFISGATEVARIACELGFDGLLDVDGIVTEDGHVIYNEVNGRTGGCSHVHAICEKLVGSRYGDKVVAATTNEVRTHSFPNLMSRIEAEGLAFDRKTQRGVVITAEDANGSGRVEALSIGRSESDVLELERSLLSLANKDELSAKAAA